MLTDARIDEIMTPLTQGVPYSWRKFARAIEAEVCRAQNAESAHQEGLPLTDATQQEAQEPVATINSRAYHGIEWHPPYRVLEDGAKLYASSQPPEPCQCTDHEQTIALQHAADTAEAVARENERLQAKVAELEAEAAENCRIIGMSSEREARHLARIAEIEKVAQAYEDQVAAHNKTLNELARKVELIDEQKGTIRALNMALGGDGSTSTENLIDANEFDAGDKGLIAACREQSALIEKCDKALRLVQKYAPITLDCEAFHHPKSMQHDSESTCEPAARYYHALNEVGEIIAAITNQKVGAA